MSKGFKGLAVGFPMSVDCMEMSEILRFVSLNGQGQIMFVETRLGDACIDISEDGNLQHAYCEGLEGIEALARILHIQDGRISYGKSQGGLLLNLGLPMQVAILEAKRINNNDASPLKGDAGVILASQNALKDIFNEIPGVLSSHMYLPSMEMQVSTSCGGDGLNISQQVTLDDVAAILLVIDDIFEQLGMSCTNSFQLENTKYSSLFVFLSSNHVNPWIWVTSAYEEASFAKQRLKVESDRLMRIFKELNFSIPKFGKSARQIGG